MVPTSADTGFPGSILAERHGCAFALLEMRDGRITHSAIYSPAAGVDGHVVSDDSVFWLGCISKTITATAVMILLDRGELSLDDPLRRFIAGLPERLGSLTVGQALAHQTGLPRNMPGWTSFFDPAWLSEPLGSVAMRVGEPDETVRGRKRLYSSPGYVLAARVVEAVASREFSAFVGSELLEPLGMLDTFCINALPKAGASRIAPVLGRTGSGLSVLFDPEHADGIANSMPFAGFFSTTRDLARFLRMLLDGGCGTRHAVLREETVARMLREEVRGQGIHQALAWFLAFPTETDPRGAQEHCGLWHTSSSGCLIAANRTNRSAVVILGQALVDSGLFPLRVVEWKHVQRVTAMQPIAARAPILEEPAWLRDFRSGGALA